MVEKVLEWYCYECAEPHTCTQSALLESPALENVRINLRLAGLPVSLIGLHMYVNKLERHGRVTNVRLSDVANRRIASQD